MTNIPDQNNENQKRESFQIFTVDSFADGLVFGQQRLNRNVDLSELCYLRLNESGFSEGRLRSRYQLNRSDPFVELEKNMMRLSRRGILGCSTIVFGVAEDPFLPFEGKFDASTKFLQLFQRYTPGRLIVQTRSPLIVIAMPVLRRLGKNVSVTLGIESCDDDVVSRYTPGMPRVSERLKTAKALRSFSVPVNLQVAPVLPYGDWKQDAGAFVRVLVEHSDKVSIRGLTDGRGETDRRVRHSDIATRLADDRKYHWLRPDSAVPLISAVERLSPSSLIPDPLPHQRERQLSIFAA